MNTTIHHTTKTISSIENLVHESQEFLTEIAHELEQKAKQKINLVVRVSHQAGEEYHTTLYQEHPYILVAPQGKKQHALLYGNWQEALYATKQKLESIITPQQQLIVVVDHYIDALPEA